MAERPPLRQDAKTQRSLSREILLGTELPAGYTREADCLLRKLALCLPPRTALPFPTYMIDGRWHPLLRRWFGRLEVACPARILAAFGSSARQLGRDDTATP